MKKLLSLMLCAAMLISTFAGCGKKAADSAETYRKLYSSELTTLNYLVTGSQDEQTVAANCVDGLVEYDKYGVVQPGLAEKWEVSADQLTWTFHLRKGVKWMDNTGKEVADVKAQDFVDAAQYVLTDTYKSETASAFYSVVANAEDYYNKKITDFSKVGVKAVDDSTLVYTLKKPTSYFLSMAYLLNGVIIHRDAHILPEFDMHEIAFADKKAGDLLFFPGHVAMYLGDNRYIHSTAGNNCHGVVINSLDPKAADYRADLPEKLLCTGSIF